MENTFTFHCPSIKDLTVFSIWGILIECIILSQYNDTWKFSLYCKPNVVYSNSFQLYIVVLLLLVYHKNILAIELQGNKTSHATLWSCKIEQQEAWIIEYQNLTEFYNHQTIPGS